MKKLGVRITAIHRIFRFAQSPFLREFIRKNIEFRKNTDSKFRKDLFKLLNNSLFGKFLFNARKNEIKTKLITRECYYEKVINSVSVNKCTLLSENALLLRHHSSVVRLSHPIVVGFFILERSNTIMLEMFYFKLKKFLWRKN